VLCECGAAIVVSQGAAGTKQLCACGRTVAIPSLRREQLVSSSPEPSKKPGQRGSPVWLLLSLFIGWGAGAAGFALIIQPILGSIFYPLMPSILAALVSGFFVGLIAAQITGAGTRQHQVPWSTLAGSLLGMVLGVVLGYVLAFAFGPPYMLAMHAVYFGMAGALAGGWFAKGS
jgi:hypothetical protein